MQNLGNFNLFTNHFVIGTKLPSADNKIKIVEALHRWLDHKDKNTSRPVWRTRYVSFPVIIDLNTLSEILNDLLHIYKKKFPYAEKQDFLDTVFGYTIHDVKRILDLNLDWIGEPPGEREYTYYYDYENDQFLDYGILDEIPIEHYIQYYRKVFELLNNLDYSNQQKSGIKENLNKKPTLSVKQIALIHIYNQKQITRINGSSIANSYGHKSGESLYQDYSFFSSRANRLAKPDSSKKMENKIKLFESIANFITTKHRSQFDKELSELKNKSDIQLDTYL